VITPPETISADTTAEFATIPFELPMAKLLSLVKDAVHEHVPLARALEELRVQGHQELPGLSAEDEFPTEWSPEQERALADVISMDQVRRVWMGSMDITELIRHQAVQELASIAAAQAGALAAAPSSPGAPFGAISSPAPKPEQKGFWFNVNA
jgi:hypothetical protein